MKKTFIPRLISIVVLLACTSSLFAQNLYLHFNDGELLYLGKDNVDSITFSNYDVDSVYHDNIVTQVIHTGYTKYQIPISSIVSISCVNQEKSYSTCPDDNHPHSIDLGLPSGTKWACCNVGASRPEGYGGYYAWGETSEKSGYTWENYKYYDRSTDSYKNLGSDIAGTSSDVAHVKWGGSWRMPSLEQIQELLNNSPRQWISVNGVYGREFTGPNGGKVFIPASGYRWHGSLYTDGYGGYYWSSTWSTGHDSSAYYLDFEQDYYYGLRDLGRSVRPVSR